HPFIAREGWAIILIAFVIAAVVTAAFGMGLIATVFWVLFALVVQFFRDPAREIPRLAGAVLSPVDGRVIRIESAKDPVTGQKALKISVFMNLFNVHSQKAPVDGTVVHVVYTPGSFVNADLDKASENNERNAVTVRMKDGTLVTFVQIAGLVARRILCYVSEGDEMRRGDRYGFIRFGSRVDVYLPETAEPMVALGEKVLGTQTILAKLPI
ncbi:MAG TPA: phosphatidylserine decarboxylase family protein, partial [Sutterella sp.]|nr:phosphatidylserine decarboxylase family protein [Sutterella sp.]